MKLITPSIPLAGRVRIGKPRGQTGSKKAIDKIDYFDFTLGFRNKKGFYDPDPETQALFGDEPRRIGPFYLVSDDPQVACGFRFVWWFANKNSGAARYKCRNVFDMFAGGDLVTQAQRLEGNEYVQYACLGPECKDYIKKKCKKEVLYRFFFKGAPRLGEYQMSVKSWAAASSLFGFLQMMTTLLPVDRESGHIIGLSKVPIYFELKRTTVKHEGHDIVVWYPVPTVTSTEGSAFEMIRELGVQAHSLLLGGTSTSRKALAEANSTLSLEEHGDLYGDDDAPEAPDGIVDGETVEVNVDADKVEELTQPPKSEPKVAAKIVPTEPEPEPQVEEKSIDTEEKSVDTEAEVQYNNTAADEEVAASEEEAIEVSQEEAAFEQETADNAVEAVDVSGIAPLGKKKPEPEPEPLSMAEELASYYYLWTKAQSSGGNQNGGTLIEGKPLREGFDPIDNREGFFYGMKIQDGAAVPGSEMVAINAEHPLAADIFDAFKNNKRNHSAKKLRNILVSQTPEAALARFRR